MQAVESLAREILHNGRHSVAPRLVKTDPTGGDIIPLSDHCQKQSRSDPHRSAPFNHLSKSHGRMKW